MKNIITVSFFLFSITSSQADAEWQNELGAILKFSDGRVVSQLSEINEVLLTVGVSLEKVPVPEGAIPLLQSATQSPLSDHEKGMLLSYFELDRSQIIEQATKSGRAPVIKNGGHLSTGETGVSPYPKVYDLKAMRAEDRLAARNKFGPLHINSTDEMLGVDEVMTLAVGGAWTWYFQVGEQAVELHMSEVLPGNPAWRLNYPGTTPHGAYFHAETGLCIAHITGPKVWKMRYESTTGDSSLLGKNPFINFDSE